MATMPPNLGTGRCKPAAGFTLLELLVVLALVGTLAALALPNAARIYDNLTHRAERDHILDQFAALGHEAMLRQRAYVVLGTETPGAPSAEGGGGAAPGKQALTDYADYEPYPLDVPDGWQVRLDAPLLVYANGVCLGGEVTLAHDDAPGVTVSLAAPFCRVGDDA